MGGQDRCVTATPHRRSCRSTSTHHAFSCRLPGRTQPPENRCLPGARLVTNAAVALHLLHPGSRRKDRGGSATAPPSAARNTNDGSVSDRADHRVPKKRSNQPYPHCLCHSPPFNAKLAELTVGYSHSIRPRDGSILTRFRPRIPAAPSPSHRSPFPGEFSAYVRWC